MLAARRGVTRREVVVDPGSSAYKSFVKAGGGEALLGVIAVGVATYGGSKRGDFFEEVAALGRGNAGTRHPPAVRIEPAKVAGNMNVEVSALAEAPDFVDYIWLEDEAGTIVSARKFKAKGPAPGLTALVPRGRQLVPLVHTARDGTTVGEAFVAQ